LSAPVSPVLGPYCTSTYSKPSRAIGELIYWWSSPKCTTV